MERQWWHNKAASQIWPKSFYDSNGDGVGDLPGITAKLDYLKELGVDIIWLSPVYQSPLADQGYDISDYQGIDPRFGTMKDMDHLLEEAKKRDIRLVMDLVVNHCSDEHIWFRKAVADPEGPYGQYFYFRKGKNGKPPCNWRGYFGGSVWSLVPGQTDLYYLHLFHKKQPDLNWENPALRREIYSMINWWLDKGVAGFRIDAIVNIKKDLAFRDYPADRPDGLSDCRRMLTEPGVAEGLGAFLEEMKRETFAPHKAFTVGEVFDTDPARLAEFIGPEGHFSTMFDFAPTCLGKDAQGWAGAKQPTTTQYRDACFASQRQAAGVGFLANIIENHDEPRGVSHYLPQGEEENEQAKTCLATASVLLRGIPFLYQGQELGMTNTRFESIGDMDDVSSHGEYAACLDLGLSEAKALAACAHYSRDNARTPVQWTGGPNAGFTIGTPWIRVNPNYTRINAEEQQARPDSVLNWYKKLLALRKDPQWEEALVWGDCEPVLEEEEGLMAYRRTGGGKTLLVVCNLSELPRSLALPGIIRQVLLNNQEGGPQPGFDRFAAQPWQAVVLEMEP